MLLRIFEYIPLLQNLVSFPLSAHKKATKKFVVLWIVSIFPILLALTLIPVQNSEQAISEFILGYINKAVNASELFVYAVAFISPLLYMVYEKYNDSDNDNIKSKLSESAVFPGYWLTAAFALFVMVVTAVGFALFKSQTSNLEASIFGVLLTTVAPYIYLFSLYCWYLTLLDSVFIGDYVERGRETENGLVSSFRNRVNKS